MNAIGRILLPPGIHDSVPAAQYHAMPAFSASGIKTIIEECPMIYRHEADNPKEDEGSVSSWMGTACHALTLEPEKWGEVVGIVHAADYKTKAAQAARDEILACGRVPLLDAQAETVQAMNRMLLAEVGSLFTGGVAECTYRWADQDTGVEMKARPDYVKPRQIIDFKTTGSAKPADFQKRMKDNLHHVQAALYLDAHEVLTNETAEWLWIVQATKAPYPVSAFKLTPAARYVGQVMARHGINLFARCTAAGRWPGYTPEPMPLDLPGWMKRDFEDREAAGEFASKAPIRIDHALAMAAQAPHGA